jgi:hypothetical protein
MMIAIARHISSWRKSFHHRYKMATTTHKDMNFIGDGCLIMNRYAERTSL